MPSIAAGAERWALHNMAFALQYGTTPACIDQAYVCMPLEVDEYDVACMHKLDLASLGGETMEQVRCSNRL